MRRLLSVLVIVLVLAGRSASPGTATDGPATGSSAADVQNGVCPPDALGNDEFGFFGSMG